MRMLDDWRKSIATRRALLSAVDVGAYSGGPRDLATRLEDLYAREPGQAAETAPALTPIRCGAHQNYAVVPLKKDGVPWPLGRVVARKCDLVVYARWVPFGPVRIRYDDLSKATVRNVPLWPSGGSVRLHLGSGRAGDLIITTRDGGYKAIVQALSASGVTVQETGWMPGR